MITASRTWFSANYSWLILVAMLFSVGLGELYRHLLSLLALVGVYQLTRAPRMLWQDRRFHLLGALFLALWLPMLASLADAAEPGRAGGATLRYLTYLLAGIAVLRFSWNARASQRLLMGTLAVILFWSMDGVLQFFTGTNLLGYPQFPGGRLTGMFNESPRLGMVLAILAPLYFEAVRQLSGRYRPAWLLLLPLIAVILLGGSRSSWLLLVVAVLLYFIYVWRARTSPLSWARWAVRALVVGAVTAVLMSQVTWLHERAQQMSGLFSGDYERTNVATSSRLPLWQVATELAGEHWFNGVGVRNYAHVYVKRNALDDDAGFAADRGHPHFFLLEIAAETGGVGLIGFAVFLLLLLRASYTWRPASAAPWGMAAVLAAFPLSATLAFYSLFCSSLIWLLVITWLVVYPPTAEHPSP